MRYVGFSEEYLDPRGGGSVSKASRVMDFQENPGEAYFSREVSKALEEYGVLIQDVMLNIRRFERRGPRLRPGVQVGRVADPLPGGGPPNPERPGPPPRGGHRRGCEGDRRGLGGQGVEQPRHAEGLPDPGYRPGAWGAPEPGLGAVHREQAGVHPQRGRARTFAGPPALPGHEGDEALRALEVLLP